MSHMQRTADAGAAPGAFPLAELVAAASEPSSDRRREVLRQVTDLFMAAPETLQIQAGPAFDDVMQTLTAQMERAVRAELAERLAPAAHPPRGTLRRLAADDIVVAGPVLRGSTALSDEDLLTVVGAQGQEHLRAVSVRRGLSAIVSDVIVQRGDDQTLGVLLRNPEAEISRRSSEAAVDRAQVNPELHAAVVERQSLPPDLLNEMYFTVETRLRRKIAARNAALDPAALEAALTAGRRTLEFQDGALPADYADAEIYVRGLKASGATLTHSLANLLRAKERTRFLVALAEVTEVDFTTAARILERKDLDALAILCRAVDLDRSLYVTLAVLIADGGQGMARAEDYGALYTQLPRGMAQRTLRFWRLRREGDLAA